MNKIIHIDDQNYSGCLIFANILGKDLSPFYLDETISEMKNICRSCFLRGNNIKLLSN